MRSVVTVSVILVLFIVLIVTSSFYVNKSVDELNGKIDLVITAVDEEEWHRARSLYLNMEKQLKARLEIFEAIYNHVDFDEIIIARTRAESYIDQQSKKDSLCELRELKTLLEHVAEKDKLVFYNIF